MYMILWWQDQDSYLSCVHNENGSIRLFTTIEAADKFADNHKCSADMRVTSIEGVQK